MMIKYYNINGYASMRSHNNILTIREVFIFPELRSAVVKI